MINGLLRQSVPSGVKVLSVDVFDTLLLRNTKPEILRFYEVACEQARLLAARGRFLSIEELLHARLLCARVSYQTAAVNRGERDACLFGIFRLMIAIMQLSHWVTENELLQLELEYEKKNLRLNQKLLAFLEAERNSKKVVLTSDTYFRRDELTRLVGSFAGCCFDNVYASCDHSLTKKGGGLFTYLLETECCAPAEVLHIGDNPHSDVAKPRAMGLYAFRLPRVKYLLTGRVIKQMLAFYRFRQEAI